MKRVTSGIYLKLGVCRQIWLIDIKPTAITKAELGGGV